MTENFWTTLGPRERRGTNAYLLCRCVCGNDRWVSQSALSQGMSKSCGCTRKLKPGQKFGRLTVVEPIPGRRYLCRCDCGRERIAHTSNLTSGTVVSCGCWRRVRMATLNAKSKTTEYRTWRSMLQRCNNPRRPEYPRYGGRGIKVCERWHIFDNFLSDMGPKPSADLSIERINNDKGYEPGNCCWATAYTQTRNRDSGNRFITFNGKTLMVTEWARSIGLSPAGMYNRLRRGWLLTDALTTPLQPPFGH